MWCMCQWARRFEITFLSRNIVMNIEADWESWHLKASSKWKLKTSVFKKNCQARRIPSATLMYVLENGTTQQGSRWLSSKLESNLQKCFLSFALIGKILRKVKQDLALTIIVTAIWQSQTWFPGILKMFSRNQLVLPQS